jgi:hypothetical protein
MKSHSSSINCVLPAHAGFSDSTRARENHMLCYAAEMLAVARTATADFMKLSELLDDPAA